MKLQLLNFLLIYDTHSGLMINPELSNNLVLVKLEFSLSLSLVALIRSEGNFDKTCNKCGGLIKRR